ncbi:MAG: DUF1592 domain-containing protein [Deltaproteobacteria bacterium]|nr:DUF1592 domain-containing protein [Deltaproteobacteria bacterium]
MDHKTAVAIGCLLLSMEVSGCGAKSAKVKDVRSAKVVKPIGSLPGESDAQSGTRSLGLSCGAGYAPGRAALRLMSHEEYDQTVSDLLFITDKASKLAVFEATPKGPSGFASDTAHVSLSPLTVTKYWTAATTLADAVIARKNDQDAAFRKIAPCAVGKSEVEVSCLESIISDFGLRAWRRPLTSVGADSEKARLLRIMQQAPSFDQGLRSLLVALLISPHFIFVSVPTEAPTPVGEAAELDNYQIASRLSYFLWGTMPDQELFDLAAQDQLSDEVKLNNQVDRMLKNDRASYLVRTIVNDWIGLDVLENLVTPGVNDALKRAMLEESWRFVADLVIQDKSITDLVAAKYTYANGILAEHYGIPWSESDRAKFQLLDLTNHSRRGVLGHASFLLATAGSTTETRPVKRGKDLALKWLCQDIPPPPPGIPPLDTSKLPPNATPRELLAVHTNSPSCASCHERLDPLGLGFESFDATGKWRSTYTHLGGAVIDSSGKLDASTEFKDTRELLDRLSGQQIVQSCLAKKVMALAVKRLPVSKDDECVATEMGVRKWGVQGKFSDLLKATVLTRQFRWQSGDAP